MPVSLGSKSKYNNIHARKCIANTVCKMPVFLFKSQCVNTLRPRQDGCQFPDDIFKCIFLNENISISIAISLKFVPKGPINNIAALVQIMAWRWLGDKPLSETMMASLLTHICVTRPQCVNPYHIFPKPYEVQHAFNARDEPEWKNGSLTIYHGVVGVLFDTWKDYLPKSGEAGIDNVQLMDGSCDGRSYM